MPKITKSEIVLLAIEELQALGYQYIYGPDIAPVMNTLKGNYLDK